MLYYLTSLSLPLIRRERERLILARYAAKGVRKWRYPLPLAGNAGGVKMGSNGKRKVDGILSGEGSQELERGEVTIALLRGTVL